MANGTSPKTFKDRKVYFLAMVNIQENYDSCHKGQIGKLKLWVALTHTHFHDQLTRAILIRKLPFKNSPDVSIEYMGNI